MKFALEVWSSDFEQMAETCARAEALGLDALYYGESPTDLNLDCWTTLAALAASTNRLRIGPVITNVLPTYRSAASLAKQVSTVAAISGGRLDLRTGVGASTAFGRPWWEPYGVDYPDYDRRLIDLRNLLDRLPALMTSDGPPVPLTLAAKGSRAKQLAAAHADVWETSFCTPEEFRTESGQMASLNTVKPLVASLEIDGFVSTSRTGLDRLLSTIRADRTEEDLAPVLERALIGRPEEAAAHLMALAEAGVQQVVVALHDPHDPDALEAIAASAELVHARLDSQTHG